MFVCTLPSPACMCSATNTRLRSTSRWMRVALREHRLERAAREDRRSSGALSSRLPRHDDRVALQRRGTSSSMRSSRSCQRARDRARRARAPRRALAASSRRSGRASLSGPPQVRGIGLREERRERVGERQLVADRQLDVDALDAVGVVAEALERDDDVLVDLERVGVLRDRRRARAVEPEFLARFGATPRRSLRRRARSRCGPLRTRPSRRRRRSRRRCRRSAPSSAGRAASPWSRSRRPSRSARRDARGRRG